MRFSLAVLVLLSACACSKGNKDKLDGVDDWTSVDIVKWFKTYPGITVNAKDVDMLGIRGAQALSLSASQLSELGVSISSRDKYKAQADKFLAIKRNKPQDVFEWRAVNLRLCDYWVLPMILNPDASLLWFRYWQNEAKLDEIDDEVDKTDEVQFWLTFLVTPSYPFYLVSKKFESKNSLVDEVIEYSQLSCVVSQVTDIFLAFINGFSTQTLSKELGRVFKARLYWSVPLWLYALFNYYVLYFLEPSFAYDWQFKIMLYLALPLLSAYRIVSSVLRPVGAALALETKQN